MHLRRVLYRISQVLQCLPNVHASPTSAHIIDSIFATDTSFFTLKIEFLL